MKMKSPTPAEQHGTGAASDNTEAFTGGWLHGTIVCIDPSRELLLLRAQETRRTLAIRWAPATQFAFEGHPSSSDNLRSGQQARVLCRFANHELKADNISTARAESNRAEHPRLPALRPEARPLSLYERQRSYHPDR